MQACTVKSSVETQGLYRMPWTMSDNAFSWLEPTRNCDLRCEYCYQVHDPNSNKSLEEFERDIKGLITLRKTDAIFIAGGEPLTHPQIVEIVRMVASYGVKPLLISNGNALTPDMVHKLKDAGLKGFVFHVDKYQNRPGWVGKSELELNKYRQKLADMVHNEGGLICGYNTTIVPETLHSVRDIVDWTMKNIHKVSFNVIIPVRMVHKDDPYDYFIGGEKLDLSKTFISNKKRHRDLTAKDLYDEILKVMPGYHFNAFLGGTERADVPKWLFGSHMGTRDLVYGNVGPRVQEIVQDMHHFVKGKYFSFLRPILAKHGRLAFLLSPLDTMTRHALVGYLKAVIRDPRRLFRRMSLQTIIVMQPQDVLPNGEQDRCDGCPNKTYWNGRLVSECRMEEYIRYGRMMTMAPKKKARVNSIKPVRIHTAAAKGASCTISRQANRNTPAWAEPTA